MSAQRRDRYPILVGCLREHSVPRETSVLILMVLLECDEPALLTFAGHLIACQTSRSSASFHQVYFAVSLRVLQSRLSSYQHLGFTSRIEIH